MKLFYLNTQIIFPWLLLLTCTVLPWKGFFLNPSPLNFLKVFKYQGVGRSNWRSGGSKICDPPLPTLYKGGSNTDDQPSFCSGPPPPLYLLPSPLIEIQSFLITITETSLNILKLNKLLVEGSLKIMQQQSKYLKQYQTCLLG